MGWIWKDMWKFSYYLFIKNVWSMKVKYDIIGKDYNVIWKVDLFLIKNLIKYLLLSRKGVYFDIGCGIGSYIVEF